MQIYLNKEKTIRLMTDSMNAWIDQLVELDATRKNVKQESRWVNVTGYYGKLDQLLNALVDSQVLNAEVSTLAELQTRIDEIRKEINEAIPILQKAFTDKRVASEKRK